MQKLLKMFKADVSADIATIEGEIKAEESKNETAINKSAEDRKALALLLAEVVTNRAALGDVSIAAVEADPEAFLSRAEAITGTAQNGDTNIGLVTRFGRTSMNVYRSALKLSGIAEFTAKARQRIADLKDRSAKRTEQANKVESLIGEIDAHATAASDQSKVADAEAALTAAAAAADAAEAAADAAEKADEADEAQDEADAAAADAAGAAADAAEKAE